MPQRRMDEAFERAAGRPLHPPPLLPEDADHAERERATIYQIAYDLARRQREWAERVLAGDSDGEC